MRIGFFDSGIGGLTVLYKAIKALPDEEFIYYADVDHVPYGTKTNEEIIGYCDNIAEFLHNKGCDAIVIACNTATSVASAYLRAKYNIPIIGVEPAVKPAVKNCMDKRILVIATPITVREKKLHDLIDRVDDKHIVDMLALPKLPVYAEKGEFDSDDVYQYLKEEFASIDISLYSEVVLGCTHFKLFLPMLKKILGDECLFFDGEDGTVNNLVRIMKERNASQGSGMKLEYYRSGREVKQGEELLFFNSVLERLSIIAKD